MFNEKTTRLERDLFAEFSITEKQQFKRNTIGGWKELGSIRSYLELIYGEEIRYLE